MNVPASGSDFRIGFGYDIHRLAAGRPLFLGGVEIPFGKGLEGHSDADVLLHSVSDALLGAAALGDIGTHFPDTDAAYKGIRSTELLTRTAGIVSSAGYSVSNIDVCVVAELPKLAPYRDEIRGKIAGCLGIRADQVSIKASTSEKCGPVGRKEAIESYAVCLLNKTK